MNPTPLNRRQALGVLASGCAGTGGPNAFALRDQQVRYLAVSPEREETIKEIELLKGSDHTAPVVMAVTVETR